MCNTPCRILSLAGCFFLVLVLAGCAKERTGPFDVPGAWPSSGAAASAGAAFGPGAPDSDVTRAAAEIAAAKVYFAFDRADIRPDAHQALNRVSSLLRQYPSIRISIHGHCDERGSREYNFGLGERRARAAYRYLVNAGVPARQIDMVTYGKMVPSPPGRGESVWSLNRRAEFVVLTTCYRP